MSLIKGINKSCKSIDRSSQRFPLAFRSLLLSTGLILAALPLPSSAASVTKVLESDSNFSIVYNPINQCAMRLTLNNRKANNLYASSIESLPVKGSAIQLESILFDPANVQRELDQLAIAVANCSANSRRNEIDLGLAEFQYAYQP